MISLTAKAEYDLESQVSVMQKQSDSFVSINCSITENMLLSKRTFENAKLRGPGLVQMSLAKDNSNMTVVPDFE